MATDLGVGLPLEHASRTCLLSMELGRRLQMSRSAVRSHISSPTTPAGTVCTWDVRAGLPTS
jgi:hypothetical protein